jgi:carbohydrate-binding DOMON domain-containing protein
MEEGYRASVILVQRVMGVVADGSIVLANVAISVVDHSGTLQRHPFGTVTLSHQGETYVMDAKEKIAKKWLLASGIITGKRPGYP